MAFLDDTEQRLRTVRTLGVESVEHVPEALRRVDDESLVRILVAATDLIAEMDAVRIAAAGVIAERSMRESMAGCSACGSTTTASIVDHSPSTTSPPHGCAT